MGGDAHCIAWCLSLPKPAQHLSLVRKLHSYTHIFVALGYFLSDVPRIVSCVAITVDFAALRRKLRLFLDGFQWQALAIDIFTCFFSSWKGLAVVCLRGGTVLVDIRLCSSTLLALGGSCFLKWFVPLVFLIAGYSGSCVCNEHGGERQEPWWLRHPCSVFRLNTPVLSVSPF